MRWLRARSYQGRSSQARSGSVAGGTACQILKWIQRGKCRAGNTRDENGRPDNQ